MTCFALLRPLEITDLICAIFDADGAADALVACLEASGADYATPVLSLARQCVAGDGLRKYL